MRDTTGIEAAGSPRYRFVQADVADQAAVAAVLDLHRPDAILHLAAETHVDRSIDGPAAFVQTNIVGSYSLLDAALGYWRRLDAAARARFRFIQVSTDEVYGALGPGGRRLAPPADGRHQRDAAEERSGSNVHSLDATGRGARESRTF